MIVLSKEQKNKVAEVVNHKGNYTFFQDRSFNDTDKVHGTEDYAAFWGDVFHFVRYGITVGGIVHGIGRNLRWVEVSNNAYNRAVANHLKAYRTYDNSQVIIIGRKYITLYQEGESCRKQVFFENIVKVEYYNHTINLIEKREDKYYRTKLLDVETKMSDMLQTILYYRVNAQGTGMGLPIEFEQMGYKNVVYRKHA